MSPTFSTIKKRFTNKGTTLLETIIYVVLLVLVMSLIVQTLVAMSAVYRDIKMTHELESSGTIAMESILREVRNSSNVVVSSSLLGVNPGILTISGVDEDGNPYILAFDVSGGTIRIAKDGGTPVALTSLSGAVTNLRFTHLTNANSEGVRVELEMSGAAGSVVKTERFYGFAILRGSY